MILSLSLLGSATGACSDPAAPAISPESFRLELLSHFEGVWGEPTQGYIDFRVVLPGDLDRSTLERIDSMAVVWPFGAIITQMPLEFTNVGGELESRRLVVRDDGLTEGWYTLTVGFEDGQDVSVGQPYHGDPLPAPQIRTVEATATAVTIEWRTTGAHEWLLSLLRVDEGSEAVLHQRSGAAGYQAREWSATMSYSPEPGSIYNVVLEMDAPYNHRELTIPIQVP